MAIASAIAWVFAVTSSLQLIGKPFPGFIYEVNLLFSTVRPAHWESSKLGIAPYDRILSADRQRLSAPADLERLVAARPIETPIVYEVLQGKQVRTVTIKTRRFERVDYLDIVLPMLLSSAGFLAIGTAAFWLKPHHPTAQSHLLLSIAFGLYNIGTFFWFLFHRFPYVHLFVINLLGSTLIHLALTFPTPKAFLRKRPWLVVLPYLPALAGLGANALWYHPLGYSASPAVFDYYRTYLSLFSGWTVFGMLWLFGSLTFSMLKGPSPLARNQAKVVLLGSLAAFVPQLIIYLLPMILKMDARISGLGVILGVVGFHLFPLSVAYAILRHQLFDIQLVLRRATLYLGLTLSLTTLYLLAAGVTFRLLGLLLPVQPGPSVPGFLAALTVAVAFRPLHDRLRGAIDRIFLGNRADALRLLADFDPGPAPDVATLAQQVVDLVEQALRPRWVRLHVGDALLAAKGDPASTMEEALTIALSGSDRLVVGPRSNDLPFNAAERQLLAALGGQAAIAFQHARQFEERLELLVKEGVANQLAAERGVVLQRVIMDLRADLITIAQANDAAQREPGEVGALHCIQESIERIDGLLNEQVRCLKGTK